MSRIATPALASALHPLRDMFLFRSLTIGLLGACILLLMRLDAPARIVVTTAAPLAPVQQAGATIIDVAPGVRPAEVVSLIRLSPGERVAAVDDRRVDSDLAAGVTIASRAPGASGFVDVDVQTVSGTHRRVLVLLH